MSYTPGTQVIVNAKVLVRNVAGQSTSIDLDGEPGVVRKVVGRDLYVETQHGIHYLHESKVHPQEG